MKPVVCGTAIAAIIVAISLVALFAFTPRVKRPGYIEGRPLLESESRLFTDPQINLQFSPPVDWAMQERTTQSPTKHRAERMLVKYKQVLPAKPVAWLKVSVAEANGDQSPATLLQMRKPPEPTWRVVKEVEDGLKVGGLPAARVTFGGPFDPAGRGPREYVSELVAVRRGAQVFFFAGTYALTDVHERQKIRTAVESAVFDRTIFIADP